MTLHARTKQILPASARPGARHAINSVAPWTRALGTKDGRDSFRRLSEVKGAYNGQQAVIMGNGPSLRQTDLGLLRDRTTFGLNRFYLAGDEIGWLPTFLVAVNDLVIKQSASDLEALPRPLFLRWSSRKYIKRRNDVTFLHSRTRPRFSTDARRGVWEGNTVTFVALQLAYHMGFTSVVLVGVDHHFVASGPAHTTTTSTGDDPNHFRPDYFGPGFRWQYPDLEGSETAYRLAERQYARSGCEVLDSTVGGHLQVFPKVPLAEALRRE